MKFTLLEVIESYLVLDSNELSRVTFDVDDEDKTILLEWDDRNESATFDLDTPTTAFADTFTAIDNEGREREFIAYTIVRLNEVPEDEA